MKIFDFFKSCTSAMPEKTKPKISFTLNDNGTIDVEIEFSKREDKRTLIKFLDDVHQGRYLKETVLALKAAGKTSEEARVFVEELIQMWYSDALGKKAISVVRPRDVLTFLKDRRHE